MTNPNWWDEKPYYTAPYCLDEDHCSCGDNGYNVEAIIAEVEKRGEMKSFTARPTPSRGCDVYACGNPGCYGIVHEDDNFCPHCGSKIAWNK